MFSCCASFFFSSRRRHTRWPRDWSSDVCSSDLHEAVAVVERYLSDPALLREQLERCHTLVRERWSAETFLQNVRRQLPPKGPEQRATAGAPGSAGIVAFTRHRTGAPDVTVEAQPGISVLTENVRRFADAERCDYVSVIYADERREVAEEVARTVTSQHRPGWPPTLPTDLPYGILGLVWD